MAGRKRAADTDSPPTTRASKTAKTEGAAPKGKKGPKTKLSTSVFKSKAPPIYVNLTQTAPAVAGEEAASPDDPGFIGAVTLTASSFATGTYGWKGSKRITVEVDNPEGTDKEKLQVQLTINATVMGSKSAKEEGEGEVEKAEEEKAGEEQKAEAGNEE